MQSVIASLSSLFSYSLQHFWSSLTTLINLNAAAFQRKISAPDGKQSQRLASEHMQRLAAKEPEISLRSWRRPKQYITFF